MRKIVTIIGFFVASTAIVQAADPAPVEAAASIDWNGAYLGVFGGYTSGKSVWSYGPGLSGNGDESGFTGGVTAGYNWATGNGLVFGVEGDIGLVDIDGAAPCANPAFSCQIKLDAQASLRARLGFASGPFMIYGTGGVAAGKVRAQTVHLGGAAIPTSGTPVNGQTEWMGGWTAGAGAEVAVATNWTIKAEYLHADFGSRVFTVDNNIPVTISPRTDSFRIGVNYRF